MLIGDWFCPRLRNYRGVQHGRYNTLYSSVFFQTVKLAKQLFELRVFSQFLTIPYLMNKCINASYLDLTKNINSASIVSQLAMSS
uniref:Uncharacterized protein n=1 Tax=Anguilla anguilla TaxID=7936 RepID=A0A0E9RGV9_ANGAN